MSPERFGAMARKRLLKDFGTLSNACLQLGVGAPQLSDGLNVRPGISRPRAIPQPVLDYLGYEATTNLEYVRKSER